MRRRVFQAIPLLMAAVAACGGGSSSPAAPAQTPSSPTGGTFTLDALTSSPLLPASSSQVTGSVLTAAIANITAGSASLKLTHTRPQ